MYVDIKILISFILNNFAHTHLRHHHHHDLNFKCEDDTERSKNNEKSYNSCRPLNAELSVTKKL